MRPKLYDVFIYVYLHGHNCGAVLLEMYAHSERYANKHVNGHSAHLEKNASATRFALFL